MASTWVRDLLGGVPATGGDNIVTMEPRDPHAPPPVIGTLYREIMEQRARIDGMEADRARLERDAATAAALAQQAISKAERAIAEERKSLLERQNRWVMITRNLGIDIQDEEEAQ